ncbi:MAG: histidinol-phosphate transaminase [Clostridia bacterium]|nr:histidinol-phosphate transaminase [Clostridia bacterium]
MKFYSDLAKSISPYTAGEQPRDKRYIKLNTNENPYPPSPAVAELLQKYDASDLRLYPDPETLKLKSAIAKVKNTDIKNIFTGNGSDEVLSMCFAAFFNAGDELAFADITYSFYQVYVSYYALTPQIIPLRNYTMLASDYFGLDCKGIVIANPNAPTGGTLPYAAIKEIIDNNRDKIVIIDQAYAAFCDESVADLISSYDNLIVVETLSKSHALAGIRCGYALADESLIKALERIRDSINSYTVNRLSMEIAATALLDEAYYADITQRIKNTRARVFAELKRLDVNTLESGSNFFFVLLDNAKDIYLALKERGILVRYFDKEGINNFIRVTVGTDSQMDEFLKELKTLLA